jgi:hypothetical protein
MDTAAMFEQASRRKLRFESPIGALTIEDLWDLPLSSPTSKRPSLDSIAIGLHRQTKDATDAISFVTPAETNAAADELQMKFDLVRHIIAVRVQERDALKAAADRREKKQRILELIAQKEDEALGQRSIDELRALAESI